MVLSSFDEAIFFQQHRRRMQQKNSFYKRSTIHLRRKFSTPIDLTPIPTVRRAERER
jgi:hypothetical protein